MSLCERVFPARRSLSLGGTSARRNVIRATGRTTQFLVSSLAVRRGKKKDTELRTRSVNRKLTRVVRGSACARTHAEAASLSSACGGAYPSRTTPRIDLE